MDANDINAAQLQQQPMLRSQGPLYPLDTTHLNPANCYVRSYDCHEQCNVNTSYNTVSLSIKENRRKLVTEIATMLGHYSGHWYAQRVRPRDLPKHPLDWSTAVLKRLCEFTQALPHGITIEQRLDIAHRTMLATEGLPSRSDSPATSVNTHNAKKSTHTSDQAKLQRLRAWNRHLSDQVRGMHEEIRDLKDEHVVDEVDAKRCKQALLDLEKATEALETCRRTCEVLGSRLEFFENSLSMEELQAMTELYEKSMSLAKKFSGFT
jgi:hypothetical protein